MCEGFGFCLVVFDWDMRDQTYFKELATCIVAQLASKGYAPAEPFESMTRCEDFGTPGKDARSLRYTGSLVVEDELEN